jgi:hypothetical protein
MPARIAQETAVDPEPDTTSAAAPPPVSRAGIPELPDLFVRTQLSFLAEAAIAPDRQIRIEVHPNRQSLEPFQVQRTEIKI